MNLVSVLRQLSLLDVLVVLHYATVKLARRGLANLGDLFLIDRIEDHELHRAA